MMSHHPPGSGPPTVALAVVTSQHGVLLARRRDRTPPWTFPGGAVEPGETPEQAAVRETLEETGLIAVARSILGKRDHPRTGRRIVYIAAEPVESTAVGVADPTSLDQVRWVRAVEVERLLPDLFPPVVEYLNSTLA